MVDFNIKNSDLITFIEKCACRGVVLITPTEKTTKNFFNYFYMDVYEGEDEGEGYIWVKAIDSEERRMFIRHKLSNVDVNEAGRFAVTDADLLIDILKRIPSNRDINFKLNEEGTELSIQTVTGTPWKGFVLRQKVLPEDLKNILDDNESVLNTWDTSHIFEDGKPKISTPEGSAVYNTSFTISQLNLVNIVGDSVKLTRDQDLKFSMVEDEKEGWILRVKSGLRSDDIISTSELDVMIDNPIEIDEKMITNIHPIVPNLFNRATFYFRIAQTDGALKYWVKSEEGNIELNFCSSSL